MILPDKRDNDATIEISLRDVESIRRYIGEGLASARQPEYRPALEWIYALAADHIPVPWSGLVADLGTLLSGGEIERFDRIPGQTNALPSLSRYEDQVLGKLYNEPLRERLGEAVQALPKDRQPKAIAFAIQRLCQNLDLPGVELSAGVVRNLFDRASEKAICEIGVSAWENGFSPQGQEMLSRLLQKFRDAGDLFRPEDALALEQGAVLLPLGQFLAYQQVVKVSEWFRRNVRPLVRRSGRQRQIAAHLRDEDYYPVGGYSSIATRGAIESLLHSQLAYMSPTDEDRPDLFDVKYLRDELFYYSRDENDFHRSRRSFWFFLSADLRTARQKDTDAPAQRIVIALAWIDALIQQLVQLLSCEALFFRVVFPGGKEDQELQLEWELLSILLRDGLQRGDIQLLRLTPAEYAQKMQEESRTIAIRCVELSTRKKSSLDPAVEATHLIVAQTPDYRPASNEFQNQAMERWTAIFQEVLEDFSD